MSTLNEIYDAVITLMEGTAGTDRTISRGKFVVLDSSRSLGVNKMKSDPRPVLLEHPIIFDDDEGDVSGNYIHHNSLLSMKVFYASDVKELALTKIINSDMKIIKRCLELPYNWTDVSDWKGCVIAFSEEFLRDTSQNEVGRVLTCDLQLAYREDNS